MPGEWSEKLSNFDKLLMVKVLRLELVQMSVTEYIIQAIGQFYVESVSSAMDVVYREINVYTPFIFVLTTGADPNSILNKFADQMEFREKLKAISLGQG